MPSPELEPKPTFRPGMGLKELVLNLVITRERLKGTVPSDDDDQYEIQSTILDDLITDIAGIVLLDKPEDGSG